MPEALKRLLSPEYLAVSEPGPLGALWALYLALGVAFALGLGGTLWLLLGPTRKARSGVQRAWAWFEFWVCLAGLGTVLGRFLNWPGSSARVWPYSLAGLAIAGALVYRFRNVELPSWLVAQFRTLAFSLPPRQEGASATRPVWRSWPWLFLALGVHLVGIGIVLFARYHWPLWSAPLVLLAILAPQVPLLIHGRPPDPLTLSPLLAGYAATLLWLLYQRLEITVIGWQGLAFPNPFISAFYVDGIIFCSVAYSLLCQIQATVSRLRSRVTLWQWATVGLLVVTLTWAGIVYLGKRTHGATASDPYAYAQMGVDLAERGTFLHRFSLFEEVIPLHIAWAPLQPVGYHIPRNDQGDCPSVWATGASVFLAIGYALMGEPGLYVTTPIMALLALAATWGLVQETMHGESKATRYLTGALAVALLATSPEHVDRLLVPMADAPAQLFTVLTLLLALRGMRRLAENRRSLWSFFLAGICFALAYWVRHTQLALIVPVIVAVTLAARAGREKGPQPPARAIAASLLVFLGGALAAALPDIVYRWRVFGGPLATETTELHLMRLEYMGLVAWDMLRNSLVAGEWGYLFPLALYGCYRLARRRAQEAAVLASAFIAVLVVHLTYRSLRLRDLISLFPLVDLAVAYGAVALLSQLRSKTWEQAAQLGTTLLPALAAGWVILSLALARWAMIDNLWKPGWASFGYMRANNRAAFDRLAELTPSEGIIGASLNAGAVTMYTDRDAIRPYDSWTEDEWSIFLEAMNEQGRPVYLLDDGGLMAEFIEKERSHRRLVPIEELEVPLFYTRERETGWLYRLELDN